MEEDVQEHHPAVAVTSDNLPSSSSSQQQQIQQQQIQQQQIQQQQQIVAAASAIHAHHHHRFLHSFATSFNPPPPPPPAATPSAIATPSSVDVLSDSPSAKRGKFHSQTTLLSSPWQLPAIAIAQAQAQLTPTPPSNQPAAPTSLAAAATAFGQPLAAAPPLSPSSGPSSTSATSFSQSSSPGSAHPQGGGAAAAPCASASGPTPSVAMASTHLTAIGAQQAGSPSAVSQSPSQSRVPYQSAGDGGSAAQPSSTGEAHLPVRKGKFVSPVWKPLEMLVLARAWRIQYTGAKSEAGDESQAHHSQHHHQQKAKTRAEKDWEVAEYLKQHGVQRDVKTAATKWDNMLGDFRRVHEWEKGPEKEEAGGKSYFRLSSAERKMYRLPASFDEDVYEEMVQFIGHRPRSVGHRAGRGGGGTSSMAGAMVTSANTGTAIVAATTGNVGATGGGVDSSEAMAIIRASGSSQLYRKQQLGTTEGVAGAITQYVGPGEALPEITAAAPLSGDGGGGGGTDGGSRGRRGSTAGGGCLRRIGRIKMIWEESVQLWGDDDTTDAGDFMPREGRIRVDNLSFLSADQLVFLDDSFTANAIEAYESGTWRGFSTDTFTCGQHLKVFGRRILSASNGIGSSAVAAAAASPPAPLPATLITGGLMPQIVLRDRTSYYLSCLKITPRMQLPSLSELPFLFNEPPPRDLRFPIRADVFMDFPPGKEAFFVASTETDCRTIVYEVVAPLIRSTKLGIEKDFLISLWDDCINRIVKVFCAEEVELIRNNHSSSTSSEERANVCGLIRKLCLWRGEERGFSSTSGSDDPAVRLVNKLMWTYGELPYILGYYAIGMKVTFCALSRGENDKLLCTNLVTISLSNPAERFSALIPCWRVAQLLPLLADTCTRLRNVHSDYTRIHSGNSKVVEVMMSQVRKTYPTRRRWAAVKHIYELLAEQRVPCVERLVKWDEVTLSLLFKPRGQPVKPSTIDALLQALKCVCTALVSVHNMSLMHRDVRWENVMKRSDIEDEWFLIDFEDAIFDEGAGGGTGSTSSSSSQQQYYYPHRLTPSSHAPEMSRGPHGLKVDVWGLGHLMSTCDLHLPEHLKDLQRRFMDPDPDQRPPIDDCFYLLMQVHSSLSHYHHHQ